MTLVQFTGTTLSGPATVQSPLIRCPLKAELTSPGAIRAVTPKWLTVTGVPCVLRTVVTLTLSSQSAGGMLRLTRGCASQPSMVAMINSETPPEGITSTVAGRDAVPAAVSEVKVKVVVVATLTRRSPEFGTEPGDGLIVVLLPPADHWRVTSVFGHTCDGDAVKLQIGCVQPQPVKKDSSPKVMTNVVRVVEFLRREFFEREFIRTFLSVSASGTGAGGC